MKVLQEWVDNLPVMQQTVLLTAIRGPDGLAKYSEVKLLLRWFRRCILVSALDNTVLTNPHDQRGGSFTGPSLPNKHYSQHLTLWAEPMDCVVTGYVKALDAIPLHFHCHFIHAVEILGYKHPDNHIKSWWYNTYVRLVSLFHLNPETEEEMDYRLGDSRDQWESKSDVGTMM